MLHAEEDGVGSRDIHLDFNDGRPPAAAVAGGRRDSGGSGTPPEGVVRPAANFLAATSVEAGAAGGGQAQAAQSRQFEVNPESPEYRGIMNRASR